MKCTITDDPPPVSEPSTETSIKAITVEKVLETQQEATSASADDTTSIQSCIPLSFTTSLVEHIDVKKLPYEFDDADKENNNSFRDARGLHQYSQIDTPSPLASFSPIVGDTNANSIGTTTNGTTVLQEKHLIMSNKQVSMGRNLRRQLLEIESYVDMNRIPRANLKDDMIETNSEASNRTIRDN